jgi:hypothetical protein
MPCSRQRAPWLLSGGYRWVRPSLNSRGGGLVRRAPLPLDGVPAFDVCEGARPITPEMVREANEEQ